MDGHTVSPFDLSQILPVGGSLLVAYSLPGSFVINNSREWLLKGLARVGGFNQCASPKVYISFLDSYLNSASLSTDFAASHM